MPSNKKLLQAAAGSAGGDNLYVEDVFSTYLYTGTGSAITINNGLDLSGEGGLVWGKSRNVDSNHRLYDTEGNGLYSNHQYASFGSSGRFTANNNGFNLTASSGIVGSYNYASWSFRKAAGFFDIVTYTGNGTARTIAHNLGSVPKMIIVKSTSDAYDWVVYHANLTNQQNLNLNTANPAGNSGAEYWNSTTATSSVFSLGNQFRVNGSGKTYVAYVFGDDAVFGEDGDEQICKMGTVTTSGSGTASINLGFEPQFIMAKMSNASNPAYTENWFIVDIMNGAPVGGDESYLQPNLSSAAASYDFVDINSTGWDFKGLNASQTYIYMAIRRPMKVPEAGTEVFIANEGTPGFTTGFPVDFNMNGATSGGYSRYALSRLTGNLVAPYLDSAATLAGSGSIMFTNGNANTVIDLATNWFAGASDIISWSFKRAPQFMDVVAYTGNGTAGTTQAHNLTVVPEFIIWKNITGTNDSWISYWSTLGVGNYLLGFNTTTASGTGSIVNSTAPTASVITLSGQGWNVNNSGSNYIACLFATLAGISKVGSVVHSGTTNVDCGFSAGARFVLVRRTDASGGWYVWDSVRGIVSGNDPYLLLNSTAAEVTNTDYIDPLASGFTLTSSFTAGTYVFLAIA